VDDCWPFFYANIPQPKYDWRMIYGLKIEGDNSELVVASDTRPRSLSFSLVVIGFGGGGVTADSLPRTPEEIKALVNDIKQAPGQSVSKWFNEFLDLMFENDNWQNVVYDEFVACGSTLAQPRTQMIC